MGIWQEHFSWKTLSRWDLLSVVIPGFPVAIGVGILSVDWFPHNLLISQLCFGFAGSILWIKFIAVAVHAKDQGLLSRISFALLVTAVLASSAYTVITMIQAHKIKGERDRDQAQLFNKIDEFILRKTEIELRETFDVPTVTKDAILEAKFQLTPQAADQADINAVSRDMLDGQNVFYFRYVRMDGHNITPMPGKSGILHLTPKAVKARSLLKTYYSSYLIPTEISEPLRELEKAITDDQEILMDTINESYATNPTSIANAYNCPNVDCNAVVDRFFSKYVQLEPRASAVTDAIRKYREAHDR